MKSEKEKAMAKDYRTICLEDYELKGVSEKGIQIAMTDFDSFGSEEAVIRHDVISAILEIKELPRRSELLKQYTAGTAVENAAALTADWLCRQISNSWEMHAVFKRVAAEELREHCFN